MKFNFKWFKQIKRLQVIYLIGFLSNFKPSAPFLYEFYLKQKNFTENQFNGEISTISTYTVNVALIIFILFFDFLSHLPFLILSLLLGIVSECLLIWSENLDQIEISQVILGISLAGEVSYYAYIYNHVEVKEIQIITGFVTAAPLVGKSISSLISQLLISQEWANFEDLHYISLSFMVIAFLLCPFLPLEDDNIYKRAEKTTIASKKFILIRNNIISAFRDKYISKWVLWSGLSLAGLIQVTGNIQVLWKKIQNEQNSGTYNGAVEGVVGLVCICASILAGIWKLHWRMQGDLVLTLSTLLQGFMILLICQIENPFMTYLFYTIYVSLFYFIITALRGELAKDLKKSTYGFTFGMVALISGVLNTSFAILLNDDVGFQLNPIDKFMVYGGYYIIVSFLGIVIGLISWLAKNNYR